MLLELEEHLKTQQEPLIEAIKAVVRIPSVHAEGSTEFPFGKDIDDALRATLQIASSLGFRTSYGEGYYGYAEIGQGDEMVGVLGHLDVVPPGELSTWTTGPFDPVEKDGRIFGRGSQDDKGPTLAAMFAAKALMDAGVKFRRRIRFIFGTDEESKWRGIRRYVEREESPTMGFTPDSAFPLTYAEKGVLNFRLEAPNESDLCLKGGHALNAVPDAMIYQGPRQDELAAKLDELAFTYEYVKDGIKVLGRAAHAAVAEEGSNAIARLAIALHAIGIESQALGFVAQEIGEDPFGINILGNCSDEPSGRLKLNLGKIDIGREEQLFFDIRIPVTIAKDAVTSKIVEAAQRYGLMYTEIDWLPPIHISRDHFMIQTLMQAYRQVTGDHESEPISAGGATYARAVENCVAFGARLPGRHNFAHQPNEHVILEDLYVAMEIYARTLHALAC